MVSGLAVGVAIVLGSIVFGAVCFFLLA